MAKSLLDLQPISRIRRNHGLEHATIHVLNKKYPEISFSGLSSSRGFTLIGEVPTEEVALAAIEALKKLRSGQSGLAYHPNCGTNFAISGLFAGLAAWVGMLGSDKKFKSKLERLPLVILLATMAFIFTRSLGPRMQKEITTSGQPGDLELTRVETAVRGGVRMHKVITQG